jgi:hypothetical protein
MPLKSRNRPTGNQALTTNTNLAQPNLVARQVRARRAAWPQEVHADLGLVDDGSAVGT